MGSYVDIAGHQTWIEEAGAGDETIVLLHGGLSNGDALLDSIGPPLGEHYRLVAPDRRGHGRTADIEGPFHYEDMVDETIGVLEQVVGGPAHLVGWSDGGIVSLLLSMRRPDLVRRQVLIGANYHFEGTRPLEMADDDPLGQAMFEAYAERSPHGGEHFPAVLEKTLPLYASEPTLNPDDLGRVTTPTLVLVGDDDIIELAHTVMLFEALPAGQLAVVPRTSHMVPMEAPQEVAHLVRDFLSADVPPQTLMPSRRRVART
jgi:pimeloyl-ACP methyl ester carboxylesterase